MNTLPSTELPVQTLLSAVTAAASGASTYSTILDVRQVRQITFMISVNPAATSGAVALTPVVSNEPASPAAGDDSWYGIGVTNGVPTGANLPGAVPSGADYTLSPSFNHLVFRPLVIRTEPASAGTDEIRMAVSVDVTEFKWLQLAYAEYGATGNPSTITVKYTLST